MATLKLLGTPQLISEHTAKRPLRPKSLLLLAYLAVETQPHSRSFLVELFWPEQPAAKGRRNLSWTLNNIRGPLPEGIVATRETVQLVPPATLDIDCVQFEIFAKRLSVASLEQAISLLSGEFLLGLGDNEGSELEQWVEQQRILWQQRRAGVLAQLVAQLRAAGVNERALGYAQTLLKLNPWQESSHVAVIDLLYKLGRTAAALAQAHTLQETFARELNVSLAPATVQLIERLQPLPARQTFTDLPKDAQFIGRRSEMQQLAMWLTDPHEARRLVSIVGMGGAGKTHLAHSAANWLVDHFPDGVTFVELHGVADRQSLVNTIASALQLATDARGTPTQRLWRVLRRQKRLLVLDNFEQLLPHAGWIADLLVKTSDLRILVTSREALDVLNEQVLWLSGLEMADAIEWLMQADVPEPEATQLATLTSGMPLAIQLSISALEYAEAAEIIVALGEDVGQLDTNSAELLPRHRSLHLLFDQIWHKLPRKQQTLLAQLTLFANGFDATAVRHVVGGSLVDLRQLTRQSLLQLDARRYTMHPLLRQWVQARETVALDQQYAFAAYYLNFANQQIGTMRRGVLQRDQQHVIQPDIENIYRAWQWAVENQATALVKMGAKSLAEVALGTVSLQRAIGLLDRAIETIDTIAVQHTLVNEWARLLQEQRSVAAEARLEWMLALNGSGEVEMDSAETAYTLLYLGAINHRKAHDQEAAALFKAAREQFTHVNHLRGVALTLRGEAAVMMSGTADEHDRAWQQLTQSLTLAQQAEDDTVVGEVYETMGKWATLGQDYQLAHTSFASARDKFEALGNVTGRVENLLNLGVIYAKQDDLVTAHATTAEALQLARQAGLDAQLTQALANSGELLVKLGDYQAGWPLIREALVYAVEDDELQSQLWLCVIMADCLARSGDAELMAHAAELLGAVLAQPKMHVMIRQTATKLAATLSDCPEHKSLDQLAGSMLSPRFAQPFAKIGNRYLPDT